MCFHPPEKPAPKANRPLDPTPPDTLPKNLAGYDATGNFAGNDATGNFAGYDATGYFAGSSSPAEEGGPRREGKKVEMAIQPRREGREEKMVIDMLQPRRGRRRQLPFPTSIPVDNNDLKSLALYVDVAGLRTLVAPEFAILIGGDTSLSTLRSGRFRPASEDRRRSYRSNRDRFKKSINARL